jgi:hypothetical protein
MTTSTLKGKGANRIVLFQEKGDAGVDTAAHLAFLLLSFSLIELKARNVSLTVL